MWSAYNAAGRFAFMSAARAWGNALLDRHSAADRAPRAGLLEHAARRVDPALQPFGLVVGNGDEAHADPVQARRAGFLLPQLVGAEFALDVVAAAVAQREAQLVQRVVVERQVR